MTELTDAQLKALDEAEKTLPEAFDTTRVARNHMRALIQEIKIARDFKALAIEEFEAGRIQMEKLRALLETARGALKYYSVSDGVPTTKDAREALKQIEEAVGK